MALLTICLVFHYIFKRPEEIYIPGNVNLDKYQPFEPEVIMDLDFGTDGKPKIQRIIHQTWKNERIPQQFLENVKTFVKHNPNWQYYLWTDDSARALIKDYYPWLLPVWDGISYSKFTIRRADALRYVVLYHFGGIYADLDAVNYRSLDKAITKHPCVFTPEPFEHAINRAWSPYLINNAVMMCAAKHPFLKQLMDNLHTMEHYNGVVDATGPGYVTTQYMLYNNLTKETDHFVLYGNRSLNDLSDSSPYFYKGKLPMSDEKSVYIANTRYFLHSLDVNSYGPLYRQCKYFYSLQLLQKRSCVNAKRLGLFREVHKYAFVDHKWQMTWIWWKRFYNIFKVFLIDMSSVHIKEIVPNYNIYVGRDRQ